MRSIQLVFFSLWSATCFAQADDDAVIRQIFDKALTDGKSYSWLEKLSTQIGARLSGSSQATAALNWGRDELKGFSDSVWLQPMVPRWVRGRAEAARIMTSKKRGGTKVNVCALGGSIATGPKGVTGWH